MNVGSQKSEVRSRNFAFDGWLIIFPVLTLLSFAASAQLTNDIPPLTPAYPEIPPTFWEQHGITITLAGLLALLVIGILVWLLLKPKLVAPPLPEVHARRALENLRQRSEDGSVLSEVSQILRRYLVATFAIPRDELTTAELCTALEGNPKVGDELFAAVSDFLRRCDERKFASATTPAPPGAAAQALELLERSEARRAQLKPVLVPRA
ncbi:MAG: DUF4381 family protein [Pedosphaera sp.]|nr:DUF4381 family protein [Pedosphaera sp.]